jgi:hypothetical protein
MERRRRRDVGIAAVERIFELWQVDETWSVREPRCFTWWAGDFRQRVYVDAGRLDRGHTIFRLSAVTDLLREVDTLKSGIAEGLAALNMFASSYAITLDQEQRSVSLCSSVVLHEGIAEWIVLHFAGLAILQVIDAQARAVVYASMIGGAPDSSHHPRAGTRSTHDQMLDLVRGVYCPMGQERSRWIEPGEFQHVAVQLQEAGLLVNGDEVGLCAEVVFGDRDDSALITVTSDEPHPQLGHGVLLRLNLPVSLSEQAAARLAVKLNAAEIGLTFTHLLGAWCSTEARGAHVPVFVSFVPNTLYRPRLLFNLVTALAGKARWACEQIAPYGDDSELDRALLTQHRAAKQ